MLNQNNYETLKTTYQYRVSFGNESAIQEFIKAYLVTLGFSPTSYKGNVMVKISGQDTHKALIFNAHVDTVAVGEISSWEYNPFKGIVEDDKVYGLGASDEKATIAVMLHLAEILVKQPPAVDVWLHFVVKEEVDGSGTKDCLEWFTEHERRHYQEVAGVLGEPTGLASIEVAHRGNVFLTLTSFGDSGHASDPAKIKTHAAFEMFAFIKKVEVLGKKWEKTYSDSIFR